MNIFKKLTSFYKAVLFIICGSLLVLIASCAQYQTYYTPPSSELGMQCINKCATNSQLCQSNCEITKSRNRMTNATERQMAAKNSRYYASYAPTDGDCGCLVQYDQCYTRCGGVVRTECVANCE